MANDIKGEQKKYKFRAIEVRQKVGNFFIAAIPAEQLIKISYSDVRRLASEQRDVERYLGIQRPLSPRRINQIRDYLSSPDASFPTAVVLSVDERCAEFDEKNSMLTLSEYVDEEGIEESIPINKIAKVLDGQHRLAGFLDKNNDYKFDYKDNDEFDINVSIFVGANMSLQAQIFATVNLAQTKVNKSLAYDLESYAQSRSPFKTCHDIAVTLDAFGSLEQEEMQNGPLFQRIKRLGVTTPGRRGETITQASFVEALVKFISLQPLKDRNHIIDGKKLPLATQDELIKTPFRNLFIEEKDVDIAMIVNNYFTAIRKKWPRSWNNPEKKGNLLPKANAFKAFMKYLIEHVYIDAVGDNYGEVPSVEKFYTYFDNLKLEDKDFTTRNFAPGGGGQSAFLKVLRGDIEPSDLFE